MTIRFLCPLGHKLAVPDELAGKKGRCPECNQRVYIPRPDSWSNQQAEDEAAFTDDDVAEDEAAADGQVALEGDGVPAGEIAPWAAPVADAAEGAGSAPPPLAGLPASDIPLAGVPQPEATGAPPPAQPLIDPAGAEPEGYEPDAGKVQTVYMLAIALGAFTAFAAAPALQHINLLDAPWWARIVLILSAVQLIYIAWMVSLPDWSTVWIGMAVFALVSAVYGVGCAIVVATPELDAINFLDLDGPESDPLFRKKVAAWCAVMLLLGTVLTYACGRFAGKWRKQYELVKAARTHTNPKR
jgi:hypothetical protein